MQSRQKKSPQKFFENMIWTFYATWIVPAILVVPTIENGEELCIRVF